MILFCAGCVPHSAFREAHDASAQVRLDVPFIAQAHRTDCGPSALASVMAYHGKDFALNEVTDNVFTPVMERSLLPDMENYARSLGFPARSGNGDLAFLRERISNGVPVIILLDMGGPLFSQGHYVVVLGHDPEGFLMHAGTTQNAFMNDRELLERWERMNRLYLVLE